MRNRRKGIRPLAWLLSVAMIITLMPSMVFAADSQDHPVWKDGVYQETARGFGGDVTVEITIENGKIISATSPTHNGESFWDLQNVNQMLDNIVTYQKADVDIATGATYSSNAVINAAKVLIGKDVNSNNAKHIIAINFFVLLFIFLSSFHKK